MSNVTNGRTPELDPVAVISEGEQQACSGVDAVSQSQSPSQRSSSQDSESLHCSESLVSSDGSQQVCQSPGITVHESVTRADMENNAKAERQDLPHEAGNAPQNEALKRETPIPVVEAEKPVSTPHMLAASFSANSSLSQLAELAVGKAQQYQVVVSSGRVGATHALINQSRSLIPGQHLPLPLGGQQPMQVPVGFGSYPSGPLMHQVPSAQFHGLQNSMQIPPPFLKGSIIQLASGELKKVEELKTEDFIQSTKVCPDIKLETSTIVTIQECSDTGTANVSFTINSSKAQGWSSCRPELSQYKFKLQCHSLKVGDACIFLSPASSGMTGGMSLTHTGVMVSGSVPKSANTSVVSANPSNILTGATLSANFPNPVATSAQIPSGVTLVGVFGQTPVSSVPGTQTVPGPSGQPDNSAGQAQVIVSAGSSETATQEKLVGGQSASDTLQAVGLVRTQQLSASPHQLLSTDHKEGAMQGTTYYNPLTGTLMTALPSQAFVQGGVMPPGSVGNGLLMAALGIVPGRAPAQFIQPGMLYGQHFSEMIQKQADPNQSTRQDNAETQREQKDSHEADLAPEAKKLKVGTQVTGLT